MDTTTNLLKICLVFYSDRVENSVPLLYGFLKICDKIWRKECVGFFFRKVIERRQYLHCVLVTLSDHCVLWEGKWHSSLFLTLYFSTITCLNQASSFTFKFSLFLFQALPYTCLSFPYLLKMTLSHTQKGGTKECMFLLAFKPFPNTEARFQMRKSKLLLQQGGLMNITARTNRRSTAPVNGGKDVFFFHTHMYHTHSENMV